MEYLHRGGYSRYVAHSLMDCKYVLQTIEQLSGQHQAVLVNL